MSTELLQIVKPDPDGTKDIKEGIKILVPQNNNYSEQYFPCYLCGAIFHSQTNLNVHSKVMHIRVKGFECRHCGKRYLSQWELNRHVKNLHVKNQALNCDVCGKKFDTSTYLDRHVAAVHLKIRAFPCKDCDKSFSQRGGLTRHQLAVHQREEALTCELCGKKIRRIDHLKDHVKVCAAKRARQNADHIKFLSALPSFTPYHCFPQSQMISSFIPCFQGQNLQVKI